MKKYIFALLLSLSTAVASSQEYLEIVSLVSENGGYATFTSVGWGEKKSDLEINAIKSLFHTLLFKGVDKVNDGYPLVGKPNVLYTETFFNEAERYVGFTNLDEVEDCGKLHKGSGGKYQRPYRIKIDLAGLISDVKRNTGAAGKAPSTPPAKPKIMVVPNLKTGETYQQLLKNFDIKAACSEVQKGFIQRKIDTDNVLSKIEGSNRRNQYEKDAASSNQKQMLLSAGADVWVKVNTKKETSAGGTKVALILEAYDAATDVLWASQTSWAGPSRNADLSYMYSMAVKKSLDEFLDQIVVKYNEPQQGTIRFAINKNCYVTMHDRCKNGRRISSVIQDWLDENTFEGRYEASISGDEITEYEKVFFPKADKKGKRMSPDKFAIEFLDYLYELGIDCEYVTERNNITITIMNVE